MCIRSLQWVICFSIFSATAVIAQPNSDKANFFGKDNRVENKLINLVSLHQYPDSLQSLNKFNKSNVEARYNSKDIKGVYPVGNGNKAVDYGILASWQTAIDKRSSFYGSASVAKGEQKNVLYDAMRFSYTYGPYTITNKLGGDFKYQQYQLEAQYALRFKDFVLGMSANYTGDYAHTETEPRKKDVTSLLGFKANSLFPFKNFNIDISLKYQHHSKTLAMTVWKGNIKQQFLLMRGFGMYDHDFIEPVFSKNRFYKQNLYEFEVGTNLWKLDKTNLDLHFNYQVSNLFTEEENTINLHNLDANTLQASFIFRHQFSNSWKMEFIGEGSQLSKEGTESRYSLKRVNDDKNFVYDYEKIGAVSPYSFNYKELRAQANLNYSSGKSEKYILSMGYGYTALEEKYKGTDFLTLIDKFQLLLGLSYRFTNEENELQLGLRFQPERKIKGVNSKDSTLESLYDQVYLPQYIYNSMSKNSYILAADYAYLLNKEQRVGLRIWFSHRRGIDLNPDLHPSLKASETIGDFAVYYSF